METIQQILIDSVSGGFLQFIGYFTMVGIILGIPAQVLMFAINRPLRHWTIRKHGYPPQHCDADGDFKKEEEVKEKT